MTLNPLYFVKSVLDKTVIKIYNKFKAIPRKDRLTAFHASCLQILVLTLASIRPYLAQKLLGRRQPDVVVFGAFCRRHNALTEKSDCAIHTIFVRYCLNRTFI